MLPRTILESALIAAGRAARAKGLATVPLSVSVLTHGFIDVSSMAIRFDRVSAAELAALVVECLVQVGNDSGILLPQSTILSLALGALDTKNEDEGCVLAHSVFCGVIDRIQDAALTDKQLDSIVDSFAEFSRRSASVSRDWVALIRKQAIAYSKGHVVEDDADAVINPQLKRLVESHASRSPAVLVRIFSSLILSVEFETRLISDRERIGLIKLAKAYLSEKEFCDMLATILKTDGSSEVRIAAISYTVADADELKAAVLYDPAAGVRAAALNAYVDMGMAAANASARATVLNVLGLKLRDKSKKVRDLAQAHVAVLLRNSEDLPADFSANSLDARNNGLEMDEYLRKNICDLFDGSLRV